MALKPNGWFRVLLIAVMVVSFVLSPAASIAVEAMPVPQDVSGLDQPASSPDEPNQRAEAARLGKWPVQVAASQGAIQPDLHGPQRTDPAEGIPIHAYSPFDERRNREYPCPPGGCDFETGHVLVKLAAGVEVASSAQQESGEFTGDAALDAALSSQGIVHLEPIFPTAEPAQPDEQIVDPDGQALPKPDLTRWYVAAFESNSADVYATVEALAKAPGVAWAEPDYLRKPVGALVEPGTQGDPEGLIGLSELSRVPAFTDPLYGQQWHLGGANVPQAWQWLSDHSLPSGGSRDIVVAVIDTGVDYSHPDLAANMWINAAEFNGTPGVDDDGNGFVDDIYGANTVTPNGNPQDDHGHGTHVAGIIAAQAGNGIGGVGVAYNVQIMALKAAQYSGVLAASDIAEAIYYAVEKGADVINMSFGGYARSQVEEDALAVAFGQAVLVAAAGNDGKVNLPCPFGRDMYPAAYNWVLGVMASTQGGSRANFSNFDCQPHDSHEYELMAPGMDIWSTLPSGQYAAWAGTSMATPVVSGIAALARTRWSDRDVYSSRFIMGQIASNAGPVANAYAALTQAPQPELSYLEHWTFDTPAQSPLNDNDGIVDAGETVDLAIVIRNHWGKADPVSVTLEPWAEGASQPDPYVTMIVDTVDYGAVGSFNTDDNGLIYDDEGVITGVQYPFRFTSDPDTPNDHVIPFRLTITAGNGYDPADPNAPYTFVSRFNLLVQRGRELPRLITEDMTLTKDYYWLVPDQSLIESGVVVTVTEGTQIQFWSADPNDPYSQNAKPFLQVEGNLRVLGTYSEPAEMFSGALYPSHAVVIRQVGSGSVELHYSRVLNPILGKPDTNGWIIDPLNVIDHSYLGQEAFDCIYRPNYSSSGVYCDRPQIRANTMSHSIFHKLGAWDRTLQVADSPTVDLYDSCNMEMGSTSAQNNVFLKNYKLYETQSGDRQYWVSKAKNAGYGIYLPTFALSVGPEENDGKTYFATSSHMMPIDTAELFASQFGGHVVTINDALEDQYLTGYYSRKLSSVSQFYPDLDCGEIHSCSSYFQQLPLIGLTDTDSEGIFSWISGELLGYTNWALGQPDNGAESTTEQDYVVHLSTAWDDYYTYYFMRPDTGFGAWIMEVPGVWTQDQLNLDRDAFIASHLFNQFTNNAILNVWWDPDINHWMRFYVIGSQDPYSVDPRNWFYRLTNNYWGTTSTNLIETAIQDFNDDFNLPHVVYQPILTTPTTTTYPFVLDVLLSTAGQPGISALNGPTPLVGAEPITFTVTFNRDMDPSVQPNVSFGPDVPETDYTVHAINGGWTNARTWQGTFNITPVTGDGYQFMRIAGARAADDPWLVTGDDSERFRFEVVTSGTNAMNLQATGGEGFVDLMWTQTDFDLLAGFNLYKATSQAGPYTRLNSTIIPPEQRTWRDTDVIPGQPYYYKFTVVKTDMTESDFSNVATATPIDTIPPVIQHTPPTNAVPGLSLTVYADVTDNVAVQSVTLFHRPMGGSTYASKPMARTTGNRYSATLPGSLVTPPGLEYYIEATDGISTARDGRPEYPHQVTVSDKPTVTSVTPNHGPAGGGTQVTIAGSNLKPGATVTFGGAACSGVTVASSSQITCSTPPHYPTAVDVTVTNPGAQSGTLLNGFTFQSDTASLSLPNTGGRQHAVVQVPINAADVQGMAAASLKVAFDSAVVHALGASTGSLTPGWSLVANTNTPGEIRLSLASPGGTVSGSGVLATIQFDVVGLPGQVSALTLQNVLLNDGAIPTQTTAGSFQVEQVYDVLGTVQFWNSGVVSGTLLTLTGDRVYTDVSDVTGDYTVGGAAADDYVLSPSKLDEANGISAYDASLALQHDAGLIVLSGHAASAADVNRSGTITSMDAFHIVQKSVDLIGLPFPGAGVVWSFAPPSRSYANLSSNQTGQDFTAVLLGDVSGNWSPTPPPAPPEQPAGSATLALSAALAAPGERITITLSTGLTQAELYAADLAVTYDPAVLTFVSAAPGATANDFMTAANSSEPGRVSLALAGASPLTAGGVLFNLVFDVAGPAGSSSPIAFQRAEINEGQVGVQTGDGLVTVVQRAALPFTPGWNLLALPLSPVSALHAQSLLDEVNAHGGACSEIDRWLNGGWDAHINNLPFNDFAVEPGKGYFLKCTAISQWTLEGFAFETAVPVALQPGWNLIGVPHPSSGYTAQSMLDAIASQGGACSEVDRWLNGGWDAHIGGLPFNNFVVAPDKGYFVKCSQASTFVPS